LFGPDALLQPNRCELSVIGPIYKMYVDYRVHRNVTAAYQNIDEQPMFEMSYGNETVRFERPSYPSAGCFFLNAEQLDRWVKSRNFLDGDTSYLGNPLDSAATLSIMKTFRIYKAVLSNASFLEVVHTSARWIGRPLAR
jgi:predicted transcriptional regulator